MKVKSTKLKAVLTITSLIIIGYMLYIPNGPDECSRSVTDSQYAQCLENIFKNQSEAETINWLESNGYSVADKRKGVITSNMNTSRENYTTFAEKENIPYGTNFFRTVGLLNPFGGDPFELQLTGSIDQILNVYVDWASSFL